MFKLANASLLAALAAASAQAGPRHCWLFGALRPRCRASTASQDTAGVPALTDELAALAEDEELREGGGACKREPEAAAPTKAHEHFICGAQMLLMKLMR